MAKCRVGPGKSQGRDKNTELRDLNKKDLAVGRFVGRIPGRGQRGYQYRSWTPEVPRRVTTQGPRIRGSVLL